MTSAAKDLRYFAEGVHAVPGWLQRDALLLTLALHRLQGAAGQGGAVAEIGVHHGKLFIALALLCDPAEPALAVDVFERQDLNPEGSGLGDRQAFQANLAAWGLEGRAIVLGRDSLTLTPPEVLALVGPVRLFSVDGGHTRRHAASDLRLAEACLAPGGVVLLDDFFQPHWPGVTEAALLHLQAPACGLAPLALCGGKLFLVRRAEHAAWRAALAADVLPSAIEQRAVEIAGLPCWVLGFANDPGLPARLGRPGAGVAPVRRLAFSLAGGAAVPGLLGQGWSVAEDWGRWSLGPLAELMVPLPPGLSPRRLLLHLGSTPRAGRAPQRLVVAVAGGDLPALVLAEPGLAWVALDLSALVLEAALHPLGAGTSDDRGPDGRQLAVVLRPGDWLSPAELGLSADPRPLGVALASLALEF